MRSTGLIFCLFLSTASAQIYKWTDESGQVHFSDAPGSGYDVETVTVEINSYKHVTYSAVDPERAGGTGKVTIYATSWCPYCRKARAYFQKNGISYIEYDIEKDTKARRSYDELGAKRVPVILVGDKRMNGFSGKGFERIYR